MQLEKIFENIMKELAPYHPKDLEPTNLNHDCFNEFSQNDNTVKVIFDHVGSKVLKISNNVEAICGYTTEELSKDNLNLFFSLFQGDHGNAIYTWVKWHINMFENGHLFYTMKNALCGPKIQHKNGSTMRILIRQTPFEFLENTMARTSVITFDFITHLMKGDFYWGRTEFGEPDNRQYHHLISTNQKDMPQDIISDREKDVLRLIAQGMESKDIAKKLFISLFTVENHRKNMLKRTGARDTTALVQLCWMCGIV